MADITPGPTQGRIRLPKDIKPMSIDEASRLIGDSVNLDPIPWGDEPKRTAVAEELPDLDKRKREPEPEPEVRLSEETAKAEETEGSEQPDQESEDAAPESEAPRISTLAELSEHLSVEESAFEDLMVPIKVGNEVRTVKLSQLKQKFHDDDVHQRRATELSQERQKLDAEREVKLAEWSQSVQAAQNIATRAKEELVRQAQGVNWAALEQEDPGRAALERQKYIEKMAAIERLEAQAKSEAQRQQGAALQAYQERLDQFKQQEHTKLLDKLPSWADESVASKERAEVTDYLRQMGFQDVELAQLYDHRTLLVARDAMHFRNMQKAAQAAKKKVAQLPKKVIKSGARPDKQQAREEAYRSDLEKLRKSGGKLRDAARFFEKHY